MQQSWTFVITLTLLAGFALFHVKYKVAETEKQLAKAIQQIEQERENIHILKAEWTHLNEPQRLQALAVKYLDVSPVNTDQVLTLATVDNAEAELFADHVSETTARPILASASAYEK